MKEITSINNEYIKYLCKLKDKKNRYKEKKFLVEGFHLVKEAYNSKILDEILTVEEVQGYKDIKKTKVNKSIIEKLSSTKTPQEIIGVCFMGEQTSIKGDKLLLLDNINDPGNMGTLIRSALGFGIDTVIVGEDCVDLYNEKTLRASQGSIFHMNVIIVDLEKIIYDLKKLGYKVFGTSLKSSINLREISDVKKYALILGNEANGVKETLLQQTDKNIKIEIGKKLESLNVAVAGSIIMYYLNN